MKNKIFSGSWSNREDDLRQLKRYHEFDVMFYRTNLYIHEKRVRAIVKKLLNTALSFYPKLDIKKTFLISEHHDDYELILKGGDISFQLKLMMNGSERSSLKEEEINAAQKIACIYHNPDIEGYKYEDLLIHAILKDCIEAQLHSFADKIDGYCEAVHEVLAENTVFLEPVINYQVKIFNHPQENFPLIKKIFNGRETKNTLFDFPVIDLKSFFQKGNIGAKPHTTETIRRKTIIPHYETWKEITLSIFEDGMDLLTKQVEFHKK